MHPYPPRQSPRPPSGTNGSDPGDLPTVAGPDGFHDGADRKHVPPPPTSDPSARDAPILVDVVPGGPLPGEVVSGGPLPGEVVSGGPLPGEVVSGGPLLGEVMPEGPLPGGPFPGGVVSAPIAFTTVASHARRPGRAFVTALGVSVAVTLVLAIVAGVLAAIQYGRVGDLRRQASADRRALAGTETRMRSDFRARDFPQLYRLIQDANTAVEQAGRRWSETPSDTAEDEAAYRAYLAARDECLRATYRYIQDAAAFPPALFDQAGTPQVPDLTADATNCRYRTL